MSNKKRERIWTEKDWDVGRKDHLEKDWNSKWEQKEQAKKTFPKMACCFQKKKNVLKKKTDD